MLLLIGAVALAGSFATDARAQQLRDAVEMAVQTHPSVASSKAEYRAAEQSINQEESGYLPSLDLSVDSGYQHARRVDMSGIDADLYHNKQRVALTQLLYDGGGTINRVRSAKATADSAHYDVLSAATKVAQEAIQAYLNVLRDRKLVHYATENIDLHNQILKEVQEAAKAGGGSESRVAQVKTRLYNALSERRRAEGNLANSVSDFREAVGEAPATLQEAPMPKFPIPTSVNEARDQALKDNSTFQAAVETERARSLTVDADRGAYLPKFDIELAREQRHGVDGVAGMETDSTALLTMTWNLYRGGGDKATVRRALEQSSAAMFRIHEVERQIRKELEIAISDYQVAHDQVALLKDRVATQVEVVKAYREQFRLGQRTLIELLDAGNELFTARSDLTTAQYREIAAAYNIFAVEGTLLKDMGIKVAMGDSSKAP